MTTIDFVSRACPACDTSSAQPVVLSTSTFGASDLDTRPAPLARSTLEYELQVCPSCGYAWYDEPEGTPPADAPTRAFVSGEEYRSVVNASALPELARAYRCRALLDEREGDLAAAGWSMLRAAWACDDDGAEPAASDCRLSAVELWRLARARRQRFAGDSGEDEAIMCDALRRAGDFDAALSECDRGASVADDDVVRAVLGLQRDLIAACDRDVHSLDELPAVP